MTKHLDDALVVQRATGDDDTSYDVAFSRAGVPRKYWNVNLARANFSTFKSQMSGDDTKTKGEHVYSVAHQTKAFEDFIADIDSPDPYKLVPYIGDVIAATGVPSDHMPCIIAGAIVKRFFQKNLSAKVRWTDANRLNRWSRHESPEDDHGHHPHLIVLTGLHPRPTPELFESVKRWTSYASSRCPIMLIGSGSDPLRCIRFPFHLKTQMLFYSENRAKSVEHIG